MEGTSNSAVFLLTTYEARSVHPREYLVQQCIREIQFLFANHFDQNWLFLVMDDFPVDNAILNDIRSLIEYEPPLFYDPREVRRRIPALESFVAHLRRYLLPTIREKLGISGLLPYRLIRDRDQRLLRSLIAYTFPYNLERLSGLTARLKSYL